MICSQLFDQSEVKASALPQFFKLTFYRKNVSLRKMEEGRMEYIIHY